MEPRLTQRPTVDEVIKDYVMQVLEENDFNISQTSREIGVDRRTLYRWLVKWKVGLPTRPPRDAYSQLKRENEALKVKLAEAGVSEERTR